MDSYPFRLPLAHLAPLFRALELGEITTEQASQAFVDHEPECALMLYANSYGCPATCDCVPKISLYMYGLPVLSLPDGSGRELPTQ